MSPPPPHFAPVALYFSPPSFRWPLPGLFTQSHTPPWLNGQYMAQPQLSSFFSCDVSSVEEKKRGLSKLGVWMQPYMWASVWWRVTAHLSFPQMRSIQEATRGGTLLGGSYFFSITIETNTVAFSWSRPGVWWHQRSHCSKSWQTP